MHPLALAVPPRYRTQTTSQLVLVLLEMVKGEVCDIVERLEIYYLNNILPLDSMYTAFIFAEVIDVNEGLLREIILN